MVVKNGDTFLASDFNDIRSKIFSHTHNASNSAPIADNVITMEMARAVLLHAFLNVSSPTGTAIPLQLGNICSRDTDGKGFAGIRYWDGSVWQVEYHDIHNFGCSAVFSTSVNLFIKFDSGGGGAVAVNSRLYTP